MLKIFVVLLVVWDFCLSAGQQQFRNAQLTCMVPVEERRGPACTCRPGKRGPVGPKGDVGSSANVQPQLNEFDQRLQQLEATVRHYQETFPKSCRDVQQRTNQSDVYTIYPFFVDIGKPLTVYCDQSTDDGQWMVIQRRVDGSIGFQKNWDSYKKGFGDVEKNYWIGLENLHRLTATGNFELRIDMTDFDDVSVFAKYRQFKISGEETKYALTARLHNGTAGDSLGYHNGKPFSTSDRDNDNREENCAVNHKGAWWYGHGNWCYSSNLNGLYQTRQLTDWTGIVWNGHRPNHSLKRVEMKIREIL